MYADRFDFKTAARLHLDRINEAESIRRAGTAKMAVRTAKLRQAEKDITDKLKHRIGRQLIALGERMTA